MRTVGLFAAGMLFASAAVFTQAPAQNPTQNPAQNPTRAVAPRAARPQAAAPVTFAETIAPIVYANCVSCHRPGEAAPFSLISYEDVAKRGSLIAQVTASRYMPPWHAEPGFGEFAGERRLTDAQVATIAAWVNAGMPRGDMQRMPRLPAFSSGWQLGETLRSLFQQQ